MKEIKLPQLGQSVEEAAIVEWFFDEGDHIEEGKPLFSVQTDKAEIEVESPETGVLRKKLIEPDEFVPVLTVVALVGAADEPLPDLSQYERKTAAAPPAADEPAPKSTAAAKPTPAAQLQAPTNGERGISPRARRAARMRHIDPAVIPHGSGPEGRVIEEDVLAYVAEADAISATPSARRLANKDAIDLRRVTGTGPRGWITKEDVLQAAESGGATGAPAAGKRIPLSPMRRIIAERMTQSKFTAPHYYVTVEVDMARAVQFRQELAEFKPSFNDLIMFGAAKALREFPLVNARWDGDAIVEVEEVNLGFAVALPQGLVVPVVKGAGDMALRELHTACKALTEKARTNKLTPDDYQGSTFTISNLGGFGVDEFTAIINQPDSGILAVGQIKDRVVPVDDEIGVRPIMKMTLSSDHRVIDGALAAQFMARLKELLEAADF